MHNKHGVRCQKLPQLTAMEFTGNVAENFNIWIQKFNIIIGTHRLEEMQEKRKTNILHNFIGDRGVEIYNSFNISDCDLKSVIKKFQEHLSPEKISVLRNDFFSFTQNGVSLEEYFKKS